MIPNAVHIGVVTEKDSSVLLSFEPPQTCKDPDTRKGRTIMYVICNHGNSSVTKPGVGVVAREAKDRPADIPRPARPTERTRSRTLSERSLLDPVSMTCIPPERELEKVRGACSHPRHFRKGRQGFLAMKEVFETCWVSRSAWCSC